MNPLSGLDLERTNLVKDVQLQDGIVCVLINKGGNKRKD